MDRCAVRGATSSLCRARLAHSRAARCRHLTRTQASWQHFGVGDDMISRNTLPISYQLPLAFDPAQLQHALAQIRSYEPQKQRTYQSPTNHRNWAGVSLYAIGGRWDDASPGGPAPVGYQETEMLSVAPYFRQVMDALACPKRSVRISILDPGGRINPHSDEDLGFDKGAVRV